LNLRAGKAVLAAVLCSAHLAGCASLAETSPVPDAPAIIVSGLEIRNELPYAITDVIIQVPATGAFAGCGNILPASRCLNRFEEVDYRADDVSISWRERGEPHSSGEFRLELPEGANPMTEYRLEVVVFAPGQAGARFLPAAEERATPR
jgi:hypothetical protein